MAITYKTRDGGNYRGWDYDISLDWKDDLVISISPALVYNSVENFSNKLFEIRAKNTYTFVKKFRFLGIFSSPIPQIHKGHAVAKEYIDEKLGDCNYKEIFKSIL
ncbi:hypothetical protein [Sphingobacterium sp. HMA12]|uniref:hypothetical protein n=1 Tax=Sphingobacterium sp. HMA12 TaxID=2050894 RepID=UPI000CEA4D28|nr:hypothetical protein [Sphingobacterium sp. HMA12]